MSFDGVGTSSFWKKFSRPSLDFTRTASPGGGASGSAYGGGSLRPLLRHLQPASGGAPAAVTAAAAQRQQQQHPAARDLVAEYSSAFAVEAGSSGAGAAGSSAALRQGLGSLPGSPQGPFAHVANLSFSSSQQRSSDSGAGPIAWQPSQQSLQGHGSVTAGIPDPPLHLDESSGSGGGGVRASVLDVPSPPDTVTVAAGEAHSVRVRMQMHRSV